MRVINLLKYYFEKFKVILILLVLLFVILVFFIFYNSKKEISIEEFSDLRQEKKYDEKISLEKIKVDIKGQIKNPGVYELDEGSRVIDAIDMSGGFTEKSNTKYLNLSKKLEDQMIIIVYSNEEIEFFENNKKEIVPLEVGCKCPDDINDACIVESKIEGIYNDTTEEDSDNKNTSNFKVSINTATLEELMTLSGIGKSKAEAIIKYREQNGKFELIEDILKVSGIGDDLYSKIKENIKL